MIVTEGEGGSGRVLVAEDERRLAGGLRNGPLAEGFAEDHRTAANDG
jgi:hypothetical protein